MSRTYRRKCKDSELDNWVVTDWVRVPGYRYYERVPLEGIELKRAINKYHSDTGVGYGWMGNAPKWYRKMIDRPKRAKDKAEVKRIVVQGDYEEYSFNPRRKDAGWSYW